MCNKTPRILFGPLEQAGGQGRWPEARGPEVGGGWGRDQGQGRGLGTEGPKQTIAQSVSDLLAPDPPPREGRPEKIENDPR